MFFSTIMSIVLKIVSLKIDIKHSTVSTRPWKILWTTLKKYVRTIYCMTSPYFYSAYLFGTNILDTNIHFIFSHYGSPRLFTVYLFLSQMIFVWVYITGYPTCRSTGKNSNLEFFSVPPEIRKYVLPFSFPLTFLIQCIPADVYLNLHFLHVSSFVFLFLDKSKYRNVLFSLKN